MTVLSEEVEGGSEEEKGREGEGDRGSWLDVTPEAKRGAGRVSHSVVEVAMAG